MTPKNFQEKANFIWQAADDILRGTFKPHKYGDVIMPFVVLRRLDLVLEPQKDGGMTDFYNHSFYDLRRLAKISLKRTAAFRMPVQLSSRI
jgi:type I restriction-modification system DNA methylase subunit